ncbi:hypothetical protein QQ045_012466 [Rhodiola kirilowii]
MAEHKLFKEKHVLDFEGEVRIPSSRRKDAPESFVRGATTPSGISAALRARTIAKLEGVLKTINEQRIVVTNMLCDLRSPIDEEADGQGGKMMKTSPTLEASARCFCCLLNFNFF